MFQPVETKVKAATTAGGITAAITTVILYLVGTIPGVAVWPEEVKIALGTIVLAAVTSASTWIAGYVAEHTHRPPSQP